MKQISSDIQDFSAKFSRIVLWRKYLIWNPNIDIWLGQFFFATWLRVYAKRLPPHGVVLSRRSSATTRQVCRLAPTHNLTF